MKKVFKCINEYIREFINRYAIDFTLILAWSLILIFSIIIYQQTNISELFINLYNSASTMAFTLSIIIELTILLLLVSIIGRLKICLIIETIIIFFLEVASTLKYQALNYPIISNDFYMSKDIKEMLKFVKFDFTILNLLAIIIILIACVIIIKKISINKIRLKTRLIVGILSIILIYIICINYNTRYFLFRCCDTSMLHDYKLETYKKGGVVLSFFSQIIEFFEFENVKLDDYSKEKIDDIKIKYANNYSQNMNEEIKPNIIVLMSESFTDVYNYNNLYVSEDPLPFIRKLRELAPIQTMISPSFAARTSIVEFELLTGFNTAFMSDGCYPYSQYMREKVPTLIDVFNENGYYTQAIHANEGHFYNREKVYPLMGFENIIFEEDIINRSNGMLDIRNKYISDTELTNQIIQAYKNRKEDKTFIFALSMQNHSPYDIDNYIQYDIDVKTDKLSKNDLNKVKNYTQGIYDADKAFEKLITYFSNEQEPTIIVFFGDHYPKLENCLDKLEVMKSINDENIYEIPLIIWSNYDVDFNKIEANNVSPSKLGIDIIQLANLEYNNKTYLKILEEFYDKIYVFKKNYIIDNKDVQYINYDNQYKELFEDYKYMQHDIFFGDKYILN